MTAGTGYGGWRSRWHRLSTGLYGPSRGLEGFDWIPGEPIAIGSLPVGRAVTELPGHGVTHSVICRAGLQTVISQDLWAERAVLGEGNVAHAPMWDRGRDQPQELWVPAVRFAVQALADDPAARVLIHCQQGRRRSVMVAYAALRLRGHSSDEAARLVLQTRPAGRLVPTYRANVEDWLAMIQAGADETASA